MTDHRVDRGGRTHPGHVRAGLAVLALAAVQLVAVAATPAAPAGAAPTVSQARMATSVAVGERFACAVTGTGGVKCWGIDYDGQLGNGPSLASSATPTDVSGLTTATAVTARGSHACALTAAGAVRCWGVNTNGELGTGTTTSSQVPVTVTGLASGARAVAAGDDHSCAVDASGGVLCWGLNSDGQLGDGTTTASKVPVAVSGLSSGVVALTAGLRQTCALTSAGGVKCWGNISMGNGSSTGSPVPVTAGGFTSGAVAVSTGNYQVCVATTAGAAKCWGSNGNSQLGDGTTTTRNQPVTVSGLGTGVTTVAAGGYHSCATLSSGGVSCWGYNGDGQLGNGTKTNSSVPVTATGLGSVGVVSAGSDTTCALTGAGGLSCWGSPADGANGNGKTAIEASPVTPGGSSADTTVVGAGSGQTCGLRADGTGRCWGDGGSGQLGDGTFRRASVSPRTVVGLSAGAGLTSGNAHACARTTGGSARCWGSNLFGELGDGTTTVRTTPVAVVGLSSGVTAIDAGGWSTCAVVSGAVQCWGLPLVGGPPPNPPTVGSPPATVTGLSSGVSSVAVGPGHACAVTTGGAVRCWGDNSGGQLGNGTTTSSAASVAVTGLSSGVVSVSVEAGVSCAALVDATVKCWGDNHYGQLGTGVSAFTPQSTVPVTVAGVSGVASVAVVGGAVCVRTTAGAVRCWGDGAYGQLGAGSATSSSATPVTPTGLGSGVSALEGGSLHLCAVLAAGGLRCWGYNYDGQLGVDPGWSPQAVSGGTTFRVPLWVTGAATPAPNAAGWNNTAVSVGFTCTGGSAPVTCPGVQAVGEGAAQSVTGTATDADGTSATATVSGIDVDLTPPSIAGAPVGAANDAGWYRSDVAIGWLCSDALSGVASCPTVSAIAGEGAGLTASGQAVDVAGNVTSASSAPVSIDRTAPVTTVSASPLWTRTDLDLVLTASDGLSGVASTTWSLDGGPDQSGLSVHVAGDGAHTLRYRSADVAGNTEADRVLTVQIDSTPPTVLGSASPAPNAAGWNDAPVQVSFSCGDGTGSGVASCSAPVTVAEEGGAQDVTGDATDAAGNTATAHVPVSIDATAPEASATVPDPAASGWYTAPVPVSFTCTDPVGANGSAGSGIASCPVSRVLAADGAGQAAGGSAVDVAGNATPVSATGIDIDQGPPTISGAATTAPGAAGWHRGAVTVHWTCQDATSGVAPGSCPADEVVSVEGSTTLTRTVSDVAGNTSAPASVTVQIDSGASTSISGAVVPAANGAGWSKGDVTVRFTCTAVSGVATCPTDRSVTGEGAGQEVTGTMTDNAGNEASSTVTVNLDRTAPAVAVTGVADGATYAAGSVPVSGCTATDSLSGVATQPSLSISGGSSSGVGAFTARCLGAVDNAGNTGSASVAYSVVPDSGTVRGTVTSTRDGAPVTGAFVRLYRARSVSAAVVASATSGAGGGFELTEVPSGTYYLYAGKSGAYYSGFAPDPVIVTGGSTRTVGLGIAPGAGASARVTGPSGLLRDATVRVLLNGNPTGARAITGADGEVVLTGLVAGTYQLGVVAYGHVPAVSAPFSVTSATASAGPVVIDLAAAPATSGLGGALRSPTGVPVAGASVRVWLANSALTNAVVNTTTDAQGRWSLAALPAGTYNVQFAKAGSPSVYHPTSVTVAPGPRLDLTSTI